MWVSQIHSAKVTVDRLSTDRKPEQSGYLHIAFNPVIAVNMYVVIHNAKVENKKTVQVKVNLDELNGHSIDKLTEKIWDALYNDLDRVSPDERLFVVGIFQQVAKQMKQA